MLTDLKESISYFVENKDGLKSSMRAFIEPHGNLNVHKKAVLIEFWFHFFDYILREGINDSLFSVENRIDPRDSLLQGDSNTIRSSVSKSIFVKEYKTRVFQLLESNKKKDLSTFDLGDLQVDIESMTMSFSEENIFSSSATLFHQMRSDTQISAKDYLKGKFKFDKERIKVISSTDTEVGTKSFDLLREYDKELLDLFGHHTIEALLIHVMSTLFFTESSVKVATLVERIEKAVRQHAQILSSIHHGYSDLRISHNPVSSDGLRLPFGKALVEFLVEREMIKLVHKDVDSESLKIRKKKKSYYLEKSVYAECLFHPSLLPVQMNLPMIYPPLDWQIECPPDKTMLDISDLSGGYLSARSHDTYRLLSSLSVEHFHIFFGLNDSTLSHSNAQNLCDILNHLQKQAFEINELYLEDIISNINLYVSLGLLMPYFLKNLNMNGCLPTILRDFYFSNKEVQEICSYNKLLQVLETNIQRARYERTILNIAKAYAGYQFYLPAFLDFRGRIYRCGILHFHERDLARSLIRIVDKTPALISTNNLKDELISLSKIVSRCAAFHYQKFSSYPESDKWNARSLFERSNKFDFRNLYEYETTTHKEFIKKAALGAKNPFQYLSLVQAFMYSFLSPRREDGILLLKKYPITQDASASAYQIMSYFLLDKTMAARTNLIPTNDVPPLIQDIYEFFRVELLSFLKKELDINVYTRIETFFTRKLVKSIYMPLIYGKTLMSTNDDIKAVLSQYMTYKECFNITRLCFKFWTTQYRHMDCLIHLIRIIGWFASTCERAVLYNTDYFTTYQDYRVMEAHSLYVYDKKSHKRRKVTLRLSSEKRDPKKTEVATFVNFIHQKDAFIAMRVVQKTMKDDAPIYTVHDNFISNALHAYSLPSVYLQTIEEMGPPLKKVNAFLQNNLFVPVKDKTIYYNKKSAYDELCSSVIPQKTIDDFLSLNIPDKIKNDKRRLKVWEKNVSRLKTYYLMYVKNVTGGTSQWKDHQKEWKKFVSQLSGEYCLHL